MVIIRWAGARRSAPAAAVVACLVGGACGRSTPEPGADAQAAFSVSDADLAVADSGTLALGPVISGTLEARQQATVRAEVGGTIVEVAVEPGQPVRRGQTLVRIDAAISADALVSAQAQVRSAEIQLDVARRNLARNQELLTAGAISERDVENASSQLTLSEAQLADAQARLTAAQKQVAYTSPTSPLAGVVSQRPVNAGDVVTPGAVLATIIDPSSMRLVASVPAEALASVSVGVPVQFAVSGYKDRQFQGMVERINPAADPQTRQVTLYVSIPNASGNLVAGLFAEGYVAAVTRRALLLPSDAVESGASDGPATVLRIRQGRVEDVNVQLGVSDPRGGRVEVLSGLSVGDTVLVGAARSITAGTPVRTDTTSAGGAGS